MGTYITAVALLVAGAIAIATGQILPGSLCFIAGGVTYLRIAFLSASPQPMTVKAVHNTTQVLPRAPVGQIEQHTEKNL